MANYTITNGGKNIEIWGTGRDSSNQTVNVTSTSSSIQEANWKLIAFPDDNINGSTYKLIQSGVGKLYIPGGTPNGWAGQPTSATPGNNLNTAVNGYRWITYANWAGSTTSSYGNNASVPNYSTSYFNPNVAYTANAYGGSAVQVFTTGSSGQITNYTDGICGPPTPCTPPSEP